ncbi:hypothetical protein ASPBRDRAFT_332179 [Aspergillus brasiliensis CBS 101740]|uniref:Uncharacterized protein n=1 Tax=Aspergillus brasiliensis (strain CBS 101740 / IMI 381727 / IBT 21946) TaxID=767769 RepID=A0A1L9U792_ASPBC|nr:hypothetical protein ASPBRDRAFT_332179 [Aspergillus brasiliensis CBS 101740]
MDWTRGLDTVTMQRSVLGVLSSSSEPGERHLGRCPMTDSRAETGPAGRTGQLMRPKVSAENPISNQSAVRRLRIRNYLLSSFHGYYRSRSDCVHGKHRKLIGFLTCLICLGESSALLISPLYVCRACQS